MLLFIIFVVDRTPPIEEVIQSGVVPRFVEFLAREDFPLLQVRSVWICYFCVCYTDTDDYVADLE